jgi:NAD(P)-dependent dehydrogenase (short-subunit alcohol dehydrogenase family)
VVVVDLDEAGAARVASAIGGLALGADVGVEADVVTVVERATAEHGRVDLFVSNAGIGMPSTVFSPDEHWQREWQVHVMANVYAARACLPGMLERREGYLVATASAVALTSQPGTDAYVVTKHAALGLMEALALTYHDRGIRVSCVCPLGMATGMTAAGRDDAAIRFGAQTLIPAEDAAEAVVRGIADERFLILTHPEVQTYFQRKASDHDRWLAGMRRLYAGLDPD